MTRAEWLKYAAAFAALAGALAGTYWLEARADAAHDREIIQAGYDFGKKVGFTLGSCDTLQAVAKANPDSKWTADTAEARAACAKAVEAYAPGTKTNLKLVPK